MICQRDILRKCIDIGLLALVLAQPRLWSAVDPFAQKASASHSHVSGIPNVSGIFDSRVIGFYFMFLDGHPLCLQHILGLQRPLRTQSKSQQHHGHQGDSSKVGNSGLTCLVLSRGCAVYQKFSSPWSRQLGNCNPGIF